MGTYDEDSAETSEKHLEIEPRINTRRKSVDSNISGKTVYILSKHFQICLDFEMCKILQSFLLICSNRYDCTFLKIIPALKSFGFPRMLGKFVVRFLFIFLNLFGNVN